MILERGTLLNNRYRIIEILGQGGMGSVYRAVDENLGMDVAVKDNLFTTEEYARQFRREAVILANLRHPNLPRVTDHFVITGQGQYLVMDYIEGEDLRQRMDRVGDVAEDEMIIIGAAVCEALTYLASRKPSIIHRDIKPGNIKITPQGQIFLVDFGLAKTLHGSQATTTGARAMTPGYSPPEQYGTARTDRRSDIFSLGATLYAALAGATPEDALSRAMDQAELTSVRKHNPRVSRKLTTVIEKALEVRPDDRYQTAEEFKKELLDCSSAAKQKEGEFVIEPAPEDSEPPGEELPVPQDQADIEQQTPDVDFILPETFILEDALQNGNESADSAIPRKRARPQRRGCMFFLVAILIVLGGGSGVAYLINPALLTGAYNQIRPLVMAAVFTPTQAGQPSATFTQVLKHTATQTEAIIIPPTSTPTFTLTPTNTLAPTDTPIPTDTPTPRPTPLGGSGQLAFVSDSTGGAQIYFINADGSGRRPITDILEGACQPDWSPDGMRLVFISPCRSNKDYYTDSAMFLINQDGSGFSPLPASVGGDYDPAWSPLGDKIAFTSLRRSDRPQIYIIDLENDYEVTLISGEYDYDSQPVWSPDGSKILFVSTLHGKEELWVMNADGSNRQSFSNSQQLTIRPHWSLDGLRILFTQLPAIGGVPKLVLAPFDLEEYIEFRVSAEGLPMREGKFSPDGFWIAYEGWEGGSSHDIYVITVNGAGRQAVTTDPSIDFDVVWRPVVIP
ncbi:protein kinase [Chloroflexota bacterium]